MTPKSRIFIQSDVRHRAEVAWQEESRVVYSLQKKWNVDEWAEEFDLIVRPDGCSDLRTDTSYHMCDLRDVDALANLIKACMADAKERIG